MVFGLPRSDDKAGVVLAIPHLLGWVELARQRLGFADHAPCDALLRLTASIISGDVVPSKINHVLKNLSCTLFSRSGLFLPINYFSLPFILVYSILLLNKALNNMH